MKRSSPVLAHSLSAVVLLAICACASPETVEVVQPTTVTGAVGQQVIIDFRTIGGGPQWDSVPVITASPFASPAAVQFVNSVPAAPPYSPGGPTQRFTFAALARGYVTVTFTRTGTTDAKSFLIDIP